jgi:hypothetical protein
MNTLSSYDGTTIAYDKQGEGPALILVDGALTVHSSGSGSELAKLLAPHFTVYGRTDRSSSDSRRFQGRTTPSCRQADRLAAFPHVRRPVRAFSFRRSPDHVPGRLSLTTRK